MHTLQPTSQPPTSQQRPLPVTSNEYCTLFDVHYLPRGLVLYESLREVCPEFHLRVLCMDQATKDVLDDLRLPSLSTIAVEDLEAHDPDLARVRAARSRVEYCWTATAPLCLFCLDLEPELELITYLDADVMFYDDPAPIFEELGEGSILLTPHRYARRWQWLERDSGTYNVQLVTFRRDPVAAGCLRWWHERCIEWCHDRVEDGKFGDQRYLDEWPEQFERVHALEHPSAGLGPWSSRRFRLDVRDERVFVDGKPLLFYHFHGLRISRPGGFVRPLDRAAGGRALHVGNLAARWSSDFPLTRFERDVIWEPYISRVVRQTERVLSLAPQLRQAIEPRGTAELMRRLALRTPPPLPALASRARRHSRVCTGPVAPLQGSHSP